MKVTHVGKLREDTRERPWWVSINPQHLRPEETIKAESLERPSRTISPCRPWSKPRDYSLALWQTPANPITSCWCAGWVLAEQSVLLKRLQVMMNSPFPPHNQGIAWFASGSCFTGVPKMYYTNWPGFRSCITDISIQRESFASTYKKNSFSSKLAPQCLGEKPSQLRVGKVTCPHAAWEAIENLHILLDTSTPARNPRIPEWFGLGETLRTIHFQSPFHGQGTSCQTGNGAKDPKTCCNGQIGPKASSGSDLGEGINHGQNK